jgi:eukaryotic-like serine/threonine-protein kinase
MVRAMRGVTGAGRVVAGRYELLDRIGQGAMGTVWRARDLVLTRDVAVKEVRLPDLVSDHDRQVLRERTLREARVSAKLSHPGVVTVHDVIEDGGTPWIVMELVDARSLDRVLAEDGPLPPQRAAETGVMLLGALASAHAAGIVHRDVKPGNALLTREGRAVLTDFGIATLDGDPGLTQTGMVMGTPGFCAPERIRGEPASPASDLWSLGATLYAAVTGHGPFDGRDGPMAVLAGILHSDPPPVLSAGPLGTVISALLSKDPARRPDAACASRLLAEAAAIIGAPTIAGPFPAPVQGPDPVWGAAPVPGPASVPGPACVPGPAHVPCPAHVLAPVPVSRLGPVPDPGPSWRPGPVGTDLAAASASTDPAGFPAVPYQDGFLASSGPDGFPAGPRAVPVPGGTGTARFPAGTGPDFFSAGAGPALCPADAPFPPDAPFPMGAPLPMGRPFPVGRPFPAGAGPVVPPGSGAGPWPASMGPAPLLAGMDGAGAGRAGSSRNAGPAVPGGAQARRAQTGRAHAGARASPGRRLLVLGFAGAAIVVAGLVVGLVWARVIGSAVGPGNGSGALPGGYHWYTRPAAADGTAPGFSMAVPAGWQAHQQGTTTYLRNPVTGGTISVSLAPAGAGGPVTEARVLERRALSLGSFVDYRRIAITPFLLRGNLAGAWRFSYRQSGTGAMDGLAVITPLTVRGRHQPYELMVTAPAVTWLPTRAAFTEAIRTFSSRG